MRSGGYATLSSIHPLRSAFNMVLPLSGDMNASIPQLPGIQLLQCLCETLLREVKLLNHRMNIIVSCKVQHIAVYST
jgi:hypothetical protein